MNQITRIAPVTDAEAARLVRPDTLADLAAEITATSVPRAPRHRGWLIAAPLAAGLAAVAAGITFLGSSGRPSGPATAGPPASTRSSGPHARASHGRAQQVQVLSFIRHGGYITVLVRDPLADPARYNAEFARHHLHIRLNLLPVSPSLVGTLVYMGTTQGASPITPITATGRCFTGGGGSACPVGVKVPVRFHGSAVLTFGRAARPGEKYESTTSALAPGEAMHGMSIRGKTVAQVLAALHRRHITVPLFNRMANNEAQNVPHVPGSWYVYSALPWAPGQVLLFVGPTRTEPAPGQPVSGTPQPSKSAAPGVKP